MSPLTFRPATSADLNAVTALVTSAYRGESSRAGWTQVKQTVFDLKQV